MRFLRSLLGVTLWDGIPNEKIRDLLQTESMTEEVNKRKLNWKQHVNRMQDSRLLNYNYYLILKDRETG